MLTLEQLALGRSYAAHDADSFDGWLREHSAELLDAAEHDLRQTEMSLRWMGALEECARLLNLPVGSSLADDVPPAVKRLLDELKGRG